jgi:hypothetical protein
MVIYRKKMVDLMGFNGFYIMGFYSDLMGYYWYIPSGNLLHSHGIDGP